MAKMDRQKAIALLKQKSEEAVHIASLPYLNGEYIPWRRNIEDVLEETFGVTSTEYKRIADFHYNVKGTRAQVQRAYAICVGRIQLEVNSIIQKYEILGIQTEPAMSEPPRMAKDYEEKSTNENSELVLEGTPDMILESIKSVTERLQSQGHAYDFHRTSGAPDYAKWDKTYSASCAISQAGEYLGTIKLQLLPKERTLVTAKERVNECPSFRDFLDSLFDEFSKLGFISLEEYQTHVTKEPPKAFIAHEGETRALAMLKEFLEALGIQYFVAESKASAGRSIEKQVDWTQSKADFAICLATKGKAINKKSGKHYMAPNIIDELGRARQVFGNKIILLVQKGVEPHTNIREIVYENFTTTNMEKAFIKIARELSNWAFIKVEKIKE